MTKLSLSQSFRAFAEISRAENLQVSDSGLLQEG